MILRRSRERPVAGPAATVALLVTAAAWLVYAATAGGSLATGDAVAMFEQARSILDRGDLAVPPEQSMEEWRGWDGRYYVPFGIGQSLYDIPWILATRAVSRVRGTDPSPADRAAKPLVALASTIPAALTVGAGLLLALELSGRLSASVVAALALAFATPTWPYAKYGFNAPLTACFATLAVWATASGVRRDSGRLLVVAGCAFGGAILTRHELMLAAAASVAWIAWQGRGQPGRAGRVLAASAGITVAFLAWCALNAVRFHDPFHSGHSPGFSFAGVEGFLFSPSGALLVYAPIACTGVLLPRLAAHRNAAASLLLAVVIALGGFYCALDDWAGTRSYGPRYLVTLMPMLVAPLAVLWAEAGRRVRRVLAAAILVSATLQLPPVLVNFATAGIEAGQPTQTVRKREWRWAPIVTTTEAALRKTPQNLCYLAGACDPPRIDRDPGRPLADRLAFSLDFWWLYAFYLGAVPRLVALLVLPASCALALWLSRRAWVLAASDPAGPDSGIDHRPRQVLS